LGFVFREAVSEGADEELPLQPAVSINDVKAKIESLVLINILCLLIKA
jgi:GTPase Era involved in 16S rRNA processing